MNKFSQLCLFACVFPHTLFAAESEQHQGLIRDFFWKSMTGEKKPSFIDSNSNHQSKDWGLAFGMRVGSIPFANTAESSAKSWNPFMYYEGDYFFLRGLEGGVHLWQSEDWGMSALMRTRYFDVPAKYQNKLGGDATDFGLQLHYDIQANASARLEYLQDEKHRDYGVFSVHQDLSGRGYQLEAQAAAIYRTRAFNSHYYGFDGLKSGGESIDGGVDLKFGIEGRVHVISNLYLTGATSATYINKNSRDSGLLDQDWQGEVFVGFGFFNDGEIHGTREIDTPHYLRVAHGIATPSNIGDIYTGNMIKDEHNNQLTSLFYGYPLSDELFGLPLDVYITPGVAHHWASNVQTSSTEFVTAVKLYYNGSWPFDWRLGVAEGLSYVDRTTYIEQNELDEKGYETSAWMNYLDFSLDLNIGDLFGKQSMKDVWFGYSLHHRSAIFEKSSQFGRIKGGSNYNTVYLQFDF